MAGETRDEQGRQGLARVVGLFEPVLIVLPRSAVRPRRSTKNLHTSDFLPPPSSGAFHAGHHTRKWGGSGRIVTAHLLALVHTNHPPAVMASRFANAARDTDRRLLAGTADGRDTTNGHNQHEGLLTTAVTEVRNCLCSQHQAPASARVPDVKIRDHPRSCRVQKFELPRSFTGHARRDARTKA